MFALQGGEVTWRAELWRGLAGFAAFTLVPRLGLPPEASGTEAAPLLGRQLWWATTAALTASGLALLAYGRQWAWSVLAVLLIRLAPPLGRTAACRNGAHRALGSAGQGRRSHRGCKLSLVPGRSRIAESGMTHLLLHRRTLLTAVASAAMPRVAAAAQAPDLPFIVLGDWGREGAHEQRAVGVTMGRAASASGSRFTLNVGDNFYEDGVSGIDDPQWADSFERIYDDPALSTPWYSILGNHDYRGNIDAQLRYRGSARWHMPARYYARTETLPDGTRVDFFHIDTSPFVLSYRGTKVRIDGEDIAAQLRWLEHALAASTATWRIVVGHHPVYTTTGGKHDTPELIMHVQPLLARYNVQMYFGGHVHNLQETDVDSVRYVTSGAGSKLGRVKAVERAGFAVERHGFVVARLSRDALRLQYVDVDGRVLRESILQRT